MHRYSYSRKKLNDDDVVTCQRSLSNIGSNNTFPNTAGSFLKYLRLKVARQLRVDRQNGKSWSIRQFAKPLCSVTNNKACVYKQGPQHLLMSEIHFLVCLYMLAVARKLNASMKLKQSTATINWIFRYSHSITVNYVNACLVSWLTSGQSKHYITLNLRW